MAVAPTMASYETLYKTYDWSQTEKALNWPRKNGYNLATLCIDGHPDEVMQRDALIWVSKDGKEERYTFADLKRETNKLANALTRLGIKQGDRVFTFLERVPEVYISVFAALKVQALVGPLFAAFGPEAIRDRLSDCQAKVLITSPELKGRFEQIMRDCPSIEYVIVVDREGTYKLTVETDPDVLLYSDLMASADAAFDVPHTDKNQPSIIHYTSGTTGKPKGAVHRHYSAVSQAATAKYVLDLQPETDVYWCTADPGWVTGTSYGMIGPWALGTTQLVYEGGFNPETWYKLIQDYKVTVWYTAPTAIRMLMKAGEAPVRAYDLSSLRHLLSVGEPLNPEAIVWGEAQFGHVFHDTWWQTETGCMHICNYASMTVKAGSMGRPHPGVVAGILDEDGNELEAGQEGHLVVRPDAPSFFQTYWGRQELYDSRFKNGWYYTGDRAWRDEDGYYWFVGRADDVINTAGHLVGPFEVESALVAHPAVAEAGVIGKPDAERMEIVKAFISLKAGYEDSEKLREEIRLFVRNRLAAHAYPREIEVLEGLPKTRSGKIMRRLLKARELGLPEGDVSTLET
ncbi:MAG: acetate--CoA ligase [Cyanobacteria bacterium HKST-UBA04]|nr:acetate--CoA ligase [Cyanobacteria bacterium HKST-UBA04]